MPGNKKNKRVQAKKKKVLSRVLITLRPDGSCECLHQEKDPRATFAALQSALAAAAYEKAFDSFMPLWKQARAVKRAMIRHRSWWYRHIVSLFI